MTGMQKYSDDYELECNFIKSMLNGCIQGPIQLGSFELAKYIVNTAEAIVWLMNNDNNLEFSHRNLGDKAWVAYNDGYEYLIEMSGSDNRPTYKVYVKKDGEERQYIGYKFILEKSKLLAEEDYYNKIKKDGE